MSDTVPPAPRGLRRLYAWMMENARGRHAWAGLAAFAFAESSFFPIPADVMLVPMVLAHRERAYYLAAWCTLFSVLGGALGYTIGAVFFDTVGRWLIHTYGLQSAFDGFRAAYAKYGYWIMVQGLTPIPYKLVTIASGAFHFNLVKFGLASIVCRAIRFYLLAALLFWFGPSIRDFIEGRLLLVTTIFVVGLVGGFVVLRHLMPRSPDKGAA